MSEHILFGQHVSFSAAQDRYAQLMTTYSAASAKIRKDFAKWYHSCGSIEKVLQGYVSEAAELIGAYVSGPLYTQLLQMDIYDISEDDYYSDCLILDTAQTTAAACKKLIQAVNQAKDEEVAYRELRKESRGRMVGGGFGLGGALKGMATAGAINAVTGMGHSVVNAVGNIGSSISASNSKRSIYKDDNRYISGQRSRRDTRRSRGPCCG